MNRSMAFVRSGRRHIATLFFLVICWPIASAEEVSIQASFKPDSGNPQRNKFINDTPSSGYCASNPSECRDNEMFSLQVPIQFDSNGPILANHVSVRQGAMFKVPTQWRDLSVVHEATGEAETVRVRIAGLGSKYVTEDIMKLVGPTETYRDAHWKLWGVTWVNPPAPCIYSGIGWIWNNGYSFFWKTPADGVCSRQAQFEIPWLRYDYLDFAYELETPNPLGMSSGKYFGQLTYRLGPNADFDMGDVMIPNKSELTLNFTLDVKHTLKVDIPPGGNHVELVPQGGWQAWLQQGRKPTRLFRDQTFNISASSRFKMNLECQYSQDGKTCSLREPESGDVVPLNISVSLPHGLTDGGGQAVSRRQLLRDGSGTELFQPSMYVDRKPGTLHFEIPADEVAEMIHTGTKRQYSGNVTVIWDSEV